MGRWTHRFLGFCLVLAVPAAGWAVELSLAGGPVRVMGYINQGFGIGIGGDRYDTMHGFQSAIFDTLLEGQYEPNRDLTVAGALQLTGDWVYPIYAGNDEWQDKQFHRSRSEIYLDSSFRDVLQELHLTWTPGSWYLRGGKQIVVWGETDGFRIMDQINPVDQRRGLGDVEFESTILPLWLLRADYHIQPQSSWLQDVSIETVFNPNADFVPNRRIVPGNDVAGIWAAKVDLGPVPVAFDPDTGAPIAFLPARLGSYEENDLQPDTWDPEGMEVGVRLRSVIQDKILTLSYFNGIDNDPVRVLTGPPSGEVVPAFDLLLLHLPVENRYHRFRTVGATFTGDLPGLSASFLGGVAPVLRLEGLYGFQNTFTTEGFGKPEQSDEIRYAVGVDWKVKASFLNPRAYFFVSGQFFHHKILDYPSNDIHLADVAGRLEEDNYQSSLLISTSYFHNKLAPSFFWLRDYTRQANFFRYQVTYEHSHRWNYTLGALFLEGSYKNNGFEPLENKDQVYGTISYRF